MRLNLARGCFHLISLPLPTIVQACTGPGWAYCLLLLGLVSKLLPEPFISSVLPAAPKYFLGIRKGLYSFIALAKVQKISAKHSKRSEILSPHH